MSKLTLNYIDTFGPCEGGRDKMLAGLGKDAPDDTEVTLLQILDICGVMDALWVLDKTKCNPRLARHFGAWCAEQVLPIFERERPNDNRPRLAIEAARNDGMTDAARAAAGAAAGDAAWAAARAAAGDAAGDAQSKQLRAMLMSGEYEVAT